MLVFVEVMLLVLGNTPPPRVAVLTYQGGVVAAALLLLVRTIELNRRAVDVANAVVEITLGPAGNVREMMSRALRDPTVGIAFAVTQRHISWVDETGRPIVRPLSACFTCRSEPSV